MAYGSKTPKYLLNTTHRAYSSDLSARDSQKRVKDFSSRKYTSYAHECLLHIELVRRFMSAALHRDTQCPNVQSEEVALIVQHLLLHCET